MPLFQLDPQFLSKIFLWVLVWCILHYLLLTTVKGKQNQ